MAWRPTEHLIEGELDNTTPGRVTGWMRFAGLKEQVTFDLKGNFHRDIRGAKIRFSGEGVESEEARRYMEGFALQQTGHAGDITAGDPPADYVSGYCYIEIYGDENGRIVIELERDQVQVIGRPIPACESDPISRQEQQAHMAGFLADVSASAGVPAIAVGGKPPIVSDPAFTHWVVVDEQIIGEAHSVEPTSNGQCFAYVRLFSMPEMAEFGYAATEHLRSKDTTSQS